MNIHLLRHLVDAVKNSGPLWCQSMFAFEQCNGELVKSVQACHNVLHQISDKYSMRCSLRTEKRPANEFELSRPVQIRLSQEEKKMFLKYGINFHGGLSFYRSIKKRDELYTSLHYREINTIDYFVACSNGEMGKIRYFVHCDESIYAVLELFDLVKESEHLREVEPKHNLKIFKINDIKDKLIYMNIFGRKIVSKFPNKYEKT